MTFNDWLNNPLYVKAKKIWEQARINQIAKGAEKYPEPLNPKSWTARQLLDHGIMENVDQLHYFVALHEKMDEMDEELEKTLKRALEAEKKLNDLLVQIGNKTPN